VVAVSHALLVRHALLVSHALLVRHALLVCISHLLATHSADNDLGPGSFDSLEHERLQRHSVRRLEQLGFAVTLTSPQTTGGV